MNCVQVMLNEPSITNVQVEIFVALTNISALQHFWACFSGCGGVGLTVGHNGLKVLFQSK